MTDLLVQGLQISLLGIGLTFAALGLLILTMVLLDRFFRPKPAAQEDSSAHSAADVHAGKVDEEVAAAIAAALLVLEMEETRSNKLGTTLGRARGSWWRRGQSALPSLARARHKPRNK